MSISVEELALDYKSTTQVGIAYGYEIHVVDDSDFKFAGRTSGKKQQAKSST